MASIQGRYDAVDRREIIRQEMCTCKQSWDHRAIVQALCSRDVSMLIVPSV